MSQELQHIWTRYGINVRKHLKCGQYLQHPDSLSQSQMWPVETCRCAGVGHDWSKDSFLSACRASFGGSEHIFFNFSYISIYKDAQSVRGTECLSFIAWRPRSVEQRAGTTAHMCKQLVYGRCCSMSWTEAWRARRGEVSRSSWAGRQHISTSKKNKILKLSTEREAMQEELNI